METIRTYIKKYNYYYWMIAIGILLFFFVGEEWIFFDIDSEFYLNPKGGEGVMPLYPIFIYGCKLLGGERYYLEILVITQSIVAIAMLFFFARFLEKEFALGKIETVILFFLLSLPYHLYLPETGITHQVLTEGIAISLFYLYFFFLLKSLWYKKYRYVFGMLGMNYILGILRSQLLFLLVVSFFVLVLVFYSKVKTHKIILGLGTIMISMAIVVVLFQGIFATYGIYLTKIVPIIQNDRKEVEDAYQENESETYAVVELEPENITITPIEPIDEKIMQRRNAITPSQFRSVLLIRTLNLLDEEDVLWYEEQEKQELFLAIYNALDNKGYNYKYARDDLYIWTELINDRIPVVAFDAVNEYNWENDTMYDESAVCIEIAVKSLIHHFDRFCYHTLRLSMSSIMSSVFFQIEPIYLLCHFIAIGLYLFAIGISFLSYKKNKKIASYMIIILCFQVIMIGVINVLFMGLQRYMLYGYGLFYSGLFLNLKSVTDGWFDDWRGKVFRNGKKARQK